MTMASYVPIKKNFVVLLSSVHHTSDVPTKKYTKDHKKQMYLVL